MRELDLVKTHSLERVKRDPRYLAMTPDERHDLLMERVKYWDARSVMWMKVAFGFLILGAVSRIIGLIVRH